MISDRYHRAVHLFAGWAVLIFFAAPVVAADAVPVVQVFVNEGRTPLVGDPEIRIPYNASQVRFLIHPMPGFVRYSLFRTQGWKKSVDALFSGGDAVTQVHDWKTRGGAMFLGLRFYGENGDLIGEEKFLANGKSPGWKVKLEDSTFSPRKETIKLPADCFAVGVFMTSAGPPASVGVFAVAGCDLVQGERPVDLSAPWTKSGNRPSMASLRTVEGRPAFVIDDMDILSHADWVSPIKAVRPGEPVVLQWAEVYSTGMGDPMTALYGTLAPGDYQFVVEETDLGGNARRRHSVDLRVTPPFWQAIWFWGSCLAATAVLGVGGGLLWSRLRLRQREEKQVMLEQERRRIARDLHDDLGAQLSQIILASSHAGAAVAEPEIKSSFRMINGLAHNVSTSLSKTIWMLNPDNDHLESLVDFLNRMLVSQCKSSGVRARTGISEMPGHVVVSNDFRHHVSLSVREAVTNALKHANPGEIWLRIRFRKDRLEIEIADDGSGLPAAVMPGNGFANMRQRAEAFHGTCEITARSDGGTRVQFVFPLKQSMTPDR